jgi:hypothetical protein
MRHPSLVALVAAGALMASNLQSGATEYAFSTYGLGGNAFGAGATPPPGTYVTEATAFYSARIGATVSFGGVTLNPGAKVDAFSVATNILYVPERKVLGGNLGLSVTIPSGTTKNSMPRTDGKAIRPCSPARSAFDIQHSFDAFRFPRLRQHVDLLRRHQRRAHQPVS